MSEDFGDIAARRWEASGLMSRLSILARADDEIEHSSGAFTGDEKAFLRKKFYALAHRQEDIPILDEAAITQLLSSRLTVPSNLQPLGDRFARIIARSLMYLSCYPFAPEQTSLTFQGLLHALILALPGRVTYLMSTAHVTGMTRERTPADDRRLIFQSLAATQQEKNTLFDHRDWRRHANRRAFDFPPEKAQYLDWAIVNSDDDGDELYHDLVDFMDATQPDKRIGWATTHRNAFRQAAKAIHKSPPLHRLVISTDKFKDFLQMLLALHLDSSASGFSPSLTDLEASSHNIVAAFVRDRDGIDWETFDFAFARLTPFLFQPLHRLLLSLLGSEEAYLAPTPPSLGLILNLARLSQINTFLYDSVSFDALQLVYHSRPESGSDKVTDIMDKLRIRTQETILLVSGTSAGGHGSEEPEVCIFGFFSPFPAQDEHGIKSTGQDAWRGCLMFQLAPVQDVFQGQLSLPTWGITDDRVCFGDGHRGVSLSLEDGLKDARVRHYISGPKQATFEATDWRGDWEKEMIVGDVELWVAEY